MDRSNDDELTVIDQITASHKVRRKIIDTASVLYARKGYRATSIQEISEKAGVSLPVTYRYVNSKSDIMRMIMEDVLTIFRDSLLKETKGIDDAKERLTIAVRLFIQTLDQHKDKALLIYQKSSSLDRSSRERIMQLEMDMVNILAGIINDGIGDGVFKTLDVDLAAYNIVMMGHTWALKRWHFKNRLSLDQYIELQTKTIMNMLLANP